MDGFYKGQLRRGTLTLATGREWISDRVAQNHSNAPLPHAEQPSNREGIQPRSVPSTFTCELPGHR